jgi:FkbM family methyltransferase
MEKLKNFAKKIPFVPTLYRNIRDKRLANKAPVETPFGFKIIAANEAMQKGEFEAADTKIFRALISDLDVVVDIGANVGWYCLHALSLDKHVIAFEMMPSTAQILLKNIGAVNGWGDNAEVFQLALADKPGIIEAYGVGTGASLIKGWGGFSSKNPTLVSQSSLDLVIGNRLAGSKVFILIDVEGVEYGVLKGAQSLLKSEPKPVWMVEITRTAQQPKERGVNPNYLATFEMFWKAGYEAYCADENMKLRACDEKEIRSEQPEANFFFINKKSA